MDIPEILKDFLSDLQSKEECKEILKFINEEPRAIQMMSAVIVYGVVESILSDRPRTLK